MAQDEIKTFEEALMYALDRNGGADKRCQAGKAAAAIRGKPRFPILRKTTMRFVENRISHDYTQATGKTVGKWGDGAFLKWLTENIGPLLKIILPLLLAI